MTILPAKPFDSGRRRFLRTSLAGVVLLGATSFIVRRTAASGPAASKGSFHWLEEDDALIVRRVAPVLLSGALPKGGQRGRAVEEITAGFDLAVTCFPPSVRAEIRELFDLLRSPLTRALLAGLWSSWERATPQQIGHFLDRWHHSRLQLLRGAYDGLHDLIAGSWYGNAAAWPRIAYPGPPAL